MGDQCKILPFMEMFVTLKAIDFLGCINAFQEICEDGSPSKYGDSAPGIVYGCLWDSHQFVGMIDKLHV